MLYTKKGDNGTTRFLGECDQRFSKSSAIAEALGTLDELNSFLGVVKMHHDAVGTELARTLHDVQENLFIVQAEVAGGDKRVSLEKVHAMEEVIDRVERELPPIKSFFIAGGTELGAMVDFARTVARRAERRVVGVADEEIQKVSAPTLAYLNRLSSLLYALARQVNHKSGIREQSPTY